MNDYYEDEWYEDEPDYSEPEITEASYEVKLCKAPNGQLYIEEIWGWKYAGQDWGETVGQWVVERNSLNVFIEPGFREVAIKWGRSLAPGDDMNFNYWWEDDEDEDDEPEPEPATHQ